MRITRNHGKPLDCYARWRGADPGDEALLLVDFELQPWWLPASGQEHPLQPLTAIYCLGPCGLQVSVTDQELELGTESPAEQYASWVNRYSLFSASPGQPLALAPAHIAKPWGQEIWLTGVEERGVCQFGHGLAATPIPWLQAAMPDELAGPAGKPLVLLKILDPAPQAVTGDLYFELHEEKREVYVVTHVDKQAWSDGRGYIRYGFDPKRLAVSGEAQFRKEYLEAVRRYEIVRRQIDGLPGSAAVDPELLTQEQQLRDAMNAFTHMRPLAVGDVVVVPLLMPHSLQHGVRTIEFQTPVYERQILSFAQKVLTQDHWDTEAAVSQMRLTPPLPEPFECLNGAAGVTVERIVDFQDFEVRRIRVAASAEFALNLGPTYGLLMIVEGELVFDGRNYGPEQALFLPAGWGGALVPRKPAQPLVLLLAIPRS